jgi:putative membrane protein
VTCGLFTRLSAAIPRPRIQFISVRQSPLHRWFGTLSVSIETAGGSGEANNVPLSRRWLVPLVPQERLRDLIREIQPEFELLDGTWQGLSPAGRRRKVRKTAIVGGLVLGSIVATLEVWLVLMTSVLDAAWPHTVLAWMFPAAAVCLWLLWLVHARAAARAIGYAQHAAGIAFRSGYWTRRTSTTNYDRVQVVALTESPFDRRWRMATLAVDTAGAGPAGHRIQIPCLDRPVAEQLHRETITRTEQTEFSWHR